MEKIKVSKDLANDITANKYSICSKLDILVDKHAVELNEIYLRSSFGSLHQLMAYLFGGQNAVYEVDDKPTMVIWLHNVKCFSYATPRQTTTAETKIQEFDNLADAIALTNKLNEALA